MERQEPRFEKDMKDVEFRPRTYRGPLMPSAPHRNEGFAWKIDVAVGVGEDRGKSAFSVGSVAKHAL